MKRLILLLTIAAAIVACTDVVRNEKIAIIPQPVSMTVDKEGGELKLSSPLTIGYPLGDSVLQRVAQFYAEELTRRLGVECSIETNNGKQTKQTIELKKSDDVTHTEGYELKIDDDNIEVEANHYSGAVYALQTLLQLMPDEVYSREKQSTLAGKTVAVPQIEIKDYPRFGYRGMHLDCSRHFFTADSVRRYIDYLAMHKMNRFHWHLTDDQGWRMESKRYPLLTEKAAYRIDRLSDDWDARTPIDRSKGEKPTYGGFYTQDEIRSLVAYAAARGIEVIPEIEIPGHSSEVFAAYPALSCLGAPQEVTPGGYYPPDMATCYCAGNEDVFTFLENILDETIALFPDAPYIHIGGDEVDKRFWSNCPKCKARMKAEGLENVDELQSYFIKRIENFVNSRGKNIIGWDEILEGGLTPNATVMSWRGIAGGIAAARQGHDVIMTPNSHLYFDYYQNTPAAEPKAIGGFISTKTVYEFNPIPEALTPDQAKHILGAQANIWAEFIESFDHIELMALPRMAALSEVVWSPAENRDWSSFSERLAAHNGRYKAMGANYHRGSDVVDMRTSYDEANKTFSVEMVSEIFGSQIHYTTDGTEPTLSSPIYSAPIEIKQTVNVKAIVALGGEKLSKVASERTIGMHKGIGAKISYNTPTSDAYGGSNGIKTLLDGITGTTRHNDGFMQGFNNKDFDVVVDLGTVTAINSVAGSFLQSVGTWIYLPAEMVVLVSEDGGAWREMGRTTHSIDPRTTQIARETMRVEKQENARYVRVVGVNKKTDEGLPGAGTINWIFADEIFID